MEQRDQQIRNKGAHSSEQQGRRRDRGEDFQNEIRNSWAYIANSWRMRISDGRGSTRPADEVVILEEFNALLELERTASPQFSLSVMRNNQIRGLLDFEQVGSRNRGIVLLSILTDSRDVTIAFRLSAALAFMRKKNQKHVKLDDFYSGGVPFVLIPLRNDSLDKLEGRREYDLRELIAKWRSL